jgi:predicted ATPase/class 3 adenylate cyclase
MLPTGTVTFLFTDIEGSTRLLSDLGDRYVELLEMHSAIVRDQLARWEGTEVSTEGDSFFAVFAAAEHAVAAAVDIQRSLASTMWPGGVSVGVRIGLHTGTGVVGGDNYVGMDVHLAARIAATAHGGQVVLSGTTAALVNDRLPADVSLIDLGRHRLKDIDGDQRIRQLSIAGLTSTFPPLRSESSHHNRLPSHLTSFIGREEEMTAGARLLSTNRLVTFTGPGGTGKTRLAVSLGERISGRFRDGAGFVPLAAVSDVGLFHPGILSALDIPDTGQLPPRERVLRSLAGQQMLLILDNLEQIPGVGYEVGALLEAAPGIVILATSRSALRVSGEQEYAVPPLDLPRAGKSNAGASEAELLFIDRARRVNSDVDFNAEDYRAIAEIVRRVDGLPLAIELAAARVRSLPPTALLERLSNALLRGGLRDLPERQQTLDSAIQWSYDLLDEPNRRLMNRFSAFVGGANLTQIENLCSDIEALDAVEGVDHLVGNSLLRAVQAPGEPRFEMLRTVREFAADRLNESGEAEAVKDTHLELFVELAEFAEPHLLTRRGKWWLDRLELDVDNMRAAFVHAIQRQKADESRRLVGAAWRFIQMRGLLFEGTDAVESALALPGGLQVYRSRALVAAAGIAYWRGDVDRCRQAADENLEICTALGDKRRLAEALYLLSFPCTLSGDFRGGDKALSRAADLFAEVGDKSGLADTHWGIGDAAYNGRHYERARSFFRQAIVEYGELDNLFGLGWAHYMFGKSVHRLGDTATARNHFLEGLRLFRGFGDLSAYSLHFADLAGIAYQESNAGHAATLLGAASHIVETTGGNLVLLAVNEVQGLTADVIADISQTHSIEYEAGRKMTPDEAVAFALDDQTP